MKRFFWAILAPLILITYPLQGQTMMMQTSETKSCESHLFQQTELGRTPNDKGLVSERLPVTPENLIEAYPRGIFPWGVSSYGLGRWYSPQNRGVLIFNDLKISRKDRKWLNRAVNSGEYQITFNHAFARVIRECANQQRYGVNGYGFVEAQRTWISEEMIYAYSELHRRGLAHSVEVWHNGELVAGLYGVFIRGIFAGESMFHKEDNAAKLGFLGLIERLRAQGHTFIDTQMNVGLAGKWGAKLVPRREFESMLRNAQRQNLSF